jgi:hypothetical protein
LEAQIRAQSKCAEIPPSKQNRLFGERMIFNNQMLSANELRVLLALFAQNE